MAEARTGTRVPDDPDRLAHLRGAAGARRRRGRRAAPDYVPADVGVKGWVALRLDRPGVNWDEVAGLAFAAYRLRAPRRLAREVE